MPAPIPPFPFYYMRHGQTDWNLDRYVMGQKDIPLNATGIEQACEAAKQIHHLSIGTIISSPLKRASQTAEIVASVKNMPITFIDDLKECGLGIREGQHGGDGLWLLEWKKGASIEGAESYADFTQRVQHGLELALLNMPKPVLIVAHGVVYWVVQDLLRLTNGVPSNGDIILHLPPHDSITTWSSKPFTPHAEKVIIPT